MKTLDMADKYEPLSYTDEYTDPDSEPTVKIQVPDFLPKVIIEGEEVYDLDGGRDTIPCPPPSFEGERGEKSYPGIGLLLCLVSGGLFWGTVLYYIFR